MSLYFEYFLGRFGRGKGLIEIARNGVQPTAQNAWGDWCNVIGTGFGVRPTTNTGDSLADAFVWVKPGGECDVSSPFFVSVFVWERERGLMDWVGNVGYHGYEI